MAAQQKNHIGVSPRLPAAIPATARGDCPCLGCGIHGRAGIAMDLEDGDVKQMRAAGHARCLRKVLDRPG
jgi:hypothetical protein